jgi:glycosyltransferase involved in cell wall biosynthesis
MNILIFNWRGPGHPHSGGAEISTMIQAKAWVAKGHSVTLFTSTYPHAKTQEIVDGVTIIRKGDQALGVHIRAIQWYLFGTHSKFDVVVDQFHGMPFFTPLYVRAKKVAFIHEVAREVWLINHLRFPWKYIYGYLGYILEPFIFKLLYTKIPFLAVSNSTKEDLIKMGIPSQNITLIYSGHNLISVKERKEKKKTLTFLGALAKDKGIEDALKTFQFINAKDLSWQFWIIGKGEDHYIKKLNDLSKEYGITKKVKFWGYVSQKEKFQLLARSHILLNPSRREGWGMINIEANSCRTPVVGYYTQGTKDSVKQNISGMLCKEKSPECLAETAMKLMSNKKVYTKMQKTGMVWSKKFTWEDTSAISLKVIENLK